MRSHAGRGLAAAAFALVAAAVLPSPGVAQAPPRPSDVLGFEVGADRTLADWGQITGYFARLAASSASVALDTLGATTNGQPMIMAVISSPRNIARLGEIRTAQARLADPRTLLPDEERRLLETQPSVILIQGNIHGSEIAASQMAMTLAYRLATNDTLQRALEQTVVLLIPSANPDGEQIITEWYRRGLGTAWEGGPVPWLYHPYVGHDNNRDWFMVTQRETRLVTDVLYRQWFPEILYDVHQMYAEGARLFVPPFVDPINPNVDPLIVRAIGHIGAEMALALQARGKRGVADGVIYDLWWHGGARSTPTRHNMIGVLTEAASVRIATPIVQTPADLKGHERGLPRYERRMNFPDPWPGGTWRLGDIVEYELIASEALVRMASQQREDYIRNFIALGRKAVHLGETESPRAYVIPVDQPDRSAVERLVEVLRLGGVTVDRRPGGLLADGRLLGESYVVPMAQPYRAHAKDLLEIQRFPRLPKYPGGPVERPYDVAGWTLPLQLGVRAIAVDSLKTARAPAASCRASASGSLVALDPRDTENYRVVIAALRRGAVIRRLTSPVPACGGAFPAGAFVVERSAMRGMAPGRLTAVSSGQARSGSAPLRLPRAALYRPWTANADEGWTRWVFDQFGVPYTSVTDSVVRAGALRDQFDLLIVPDMSLREARDGMLATSVPPQYAGGLGASGLASLSAFVHAGGTLVTFDRAAELAMAAVDLPVARVSVPPRSDDWEEEDRAADTTASRAEPLYAPGSILRVLIDRTHPVAYGMQDTAAVYFTNSVSFDVPSPGGLRVIAHYPARAQDILLSGFLQGGDAIAGKAAAVEATVGRGRVIMFGFRPQYRGQSYGTFKMVFNALLDGGTIPARR